MFTVFVVSTPGTAPGFRLAGINVVEAKTAVEGRRAVLELINDQRAGIIAIDEQLTGAFDEPLQAKLDRLFRPIVVTLPSAEKIVAQESKRLYLERLIKRAVGFELKLS